MYTGTTEINTYDTTLSLNDALPIPAITFGVPARALERVDMSAGPGYPPADAGPPMLIPSVRSPRGAHERHPTVRRRRRGQGPEPTQLPEVRGARRRRGRRGDGGRVRHRPGSDRKGTRLNPSH